MNFELEEKMGMLDVMDRPEATEKGPGRDIVNDFAIEIATVNGSGSQTANSLLARALFKMGIPVTSKNLFPSNISGLPTWYTIRLSKDGYVARRDTSEISVAFNPATAQDDYARLPSGGVCFHPDDLKLLNPREDVTTIALPAKEMMKQANVDPKLRDHVTNMVYVGAVAHVLGIELDELQSGLVHHFKGKMKAVEMNMNVVRMVLDWAKENLTQAIPYRVERMNATEISDVSRRAT